MKILMAARANGLQAIDGPYTKVRDPDGFRDYCQRTYILGFDGKWALHPDQVAILNEVFSPTQDQFDKACNVLDAYEEATTTGDRKGAVMFGDEMIDEASRKVAIKVRMRGERNRMQRTTSAAERAHRGRPVRRRWGAGAPRSDGSRSAPHPVRRRSRCARTPSRFTTRAWP
jgi:citrate lyase subunit beta/citryl-CoA lyase